MSAWDDASLRGDLPDVAAPKADPIESARDTLTQAHDDAAASLARLRADRKRLNEQIAVLVAHEQQLARSLAALTRPKRTRTKGPK